MPGLADIGYPDTPTTPFHGGETAALARMAGTACRCFLFLSAPACQALAWLVLPPMLCIITTTGKSPPCPTPHLPPPTPAHLPADYLSDKAWVASFEKPKGNPAALLRPATTVLSPYLKFGCLSPRLFHARLLQASSRNCRGS